MRVMSCRPHPSAHAELKDRVGALSRPPPRRGAGEHRGRIHQLRQGDLVCAPLFMRTLTSVCDRSAFQLASLELAKQPQCFFMDNDCFTKHPRDWSLEFRALVTYQWQLSLSAISDVCHFVNKLAGVSSEAFTKMQEKRDEVK